MRKYEALTDEQLSAKITTFRDAIEAAALGGEVTEIAGEGRRMVVGKGSTALAERLLSEYESEWDFRHPPTSRGRAIGVSIVQ